MASLKTNVGNLEDEKISLLTVIKVLQTDADPSQPPIITMSLTGKESMGALCQKSAVSLSIKTIR